MVSLPNSPEVEEVLTCIALETILPFPVSVHHLGLFRDKMSLQPVEYYNNLPQPKRGEKAAASLAILVDPVVATGGTAVAAIQTLKEWGVDKVILISVLAAVPGIRKAAEEWPQGTEIYVGGLDQDLTDKGMINPGLGDIGKPLTSLILPQI
jgi:uracil phosphoribosyltransferase